MRALIVGGAPVQGSAELVANLAVHADRVIGVDSGADVALDAGVGVDQIVGDLDSVSAGALARARELGAEVLEYDADKDETDLELALAAAVNGGATDIAVTAAFADRIDHTLAALGAVSRVTAARIRIVEPHFSAIVMDARGRNVETVEGTGTLFSLIPIGGRALVDCSGAKWSLREAWLEPLSGIGMSNVVSGEAAIVKVHEGTLLLVLTAG